MGSQSGVGVRASPRGQGFWSAGVCGRGLGTPAFQHWAQGGHPAQGGHLWTQSQD